MASRTPRAKRVMLPTLEPSYEVRARRIAGNELRVEIWQLPSPSSPHIHVPVRVAGLAGRNLDINQVRILKKLKDAGIRLEVMPIEGLRAPIREDAALRLALLLRTLAPMRSRTAMVHVSEGIEAMAREEAAYWLGMAVHRKNPRRVLTALRILLTAPAR